MGRFSRGLGALYLLGRRQNNALLAQLGLDSGLGVKPKREMTGQNGSPAKGLSSAELKAKREARAKEMQRRREVMAAVGPSRRSGRVAAMQEKAGEER